MSFNIIMYLLIVEISISKCIIQYALYHLFKYQYNVNMSSNRHANVFYDQKLIKDHYIV